MTDPHETPPHDLGRDELPTEELPRPDASEAMPPAPRHRPHEPGARPQDERTFRNGQLVAGRYRILRFIAAGGRGEVYEALDTELDERVAVKCIRQQAAEDPKAALRLKREILLARRITHPGVCRLFDVEYHTGETGSGPLLFLTMELLNGETLVQLLERRGRFSTEEALPIVEQLCDGLHAAHQAGVIHRDFKSDNVMLVPTEGGERRVVIMDFGLARADSDTNFATLTATGKVVGTPAYMAPEQIQGDVVDRRADLYALGVVMFEMVTGALPFVGDSPLSTAVKRLKRAPPSPRDRLPDLDPRWERVILRCLARDRGRRFATALEVKEALRGERPARGGRIWRRPASGALIWPRVLIGAAMLALLLGVGYQLAARRQLSAIADAPRPAAAAHQASVRRPTVGVLGLRNVVQSGATDWREEVVSRLISEGMSHVAAVRSVSYDGLWWRIREAGLDGAEVLDAKPLQEKLSLLGVDYLVTGSYLLLGGPSPQSLRLDLRLVRCADGETMTTLGEVGTEDELPGLVDRVVLALAERLHPGADAGIWPLHHQLQDAPLAGLRALYAGRDALRMSDLATAEDELGDAARLLRDQPLVESALGELYARQGRDEEARQAYRAAWMDSAGQPVEVRLKREADYRRAQGEWKRLAEIDTVLSGLFPDELEYRLDLAQAQLRLRHPESARATLESAREEFVDGASLARIDLFESNSADLRPAIEDRVELARRAVQRAAELGDRRLEAQGRLRLARALSAAADPARGALMLRPALASMHDLGEVGLETEVMCELAALQLEGGKRASAAETASQARALASSHGLIELGRRAAEILERAQAPDVG